MNSQITSLLWVGQRLPEIYREPPGKGYRHFLSKREIIGFINILPDWNVLSKGLKSIKLVKGVNGSDGWYDGTTMAINAWERDLWRRVPPEYFFMHQEIFSRLGVESVKEGGVYLCKFDVFAVKAFQLLHIFLHELGHHYDKITTKFQKEASRGEQYAEAYAYKYESAIWNEYLKTNKR